MSREQLTENIWQDEAGELYWRYGVDRTLNGEQLWEVPVGKGAVSDELADALREERKRSAELAEANSKLTETVVASEDYRRAYQRGKVELYAMGGEFTEAAMKCLPCGEGPLDRRFRQLIELPRLKAKDEEIARLKRQVARYRSALEHYADKTNWCTSVGDSDYGKDLWQGPDDDGFNVAQQALSEDREAAEE